MLVVRSAAAAAAAPPPAGLDRFLVSYTSSESGTPRMGFSGEGGGGRRAIRRSGRPQLGSRLPFLLGTSSFFYAAAVVTAARPLAGAEVRLIFLSRLSVALTRRGGSARYVVQSRS